MPQQRVFTNQTITPYGFQIRHNLTEREFKAVRHKWQLTSPTHSQASLIHLISHYSDKGWSACDPLDPYRNLAAYSNSRLGAIANQLQNRTELPSRSVFVTGTALHELLLQPETVADARDYYLSPTKLELVYRMRDELLNSGVMDAIVEGAEIESVVTWTDPGTGLPCKGKLDAIIENTQEGYKRVYDIKTTSCTTQETFEDSLLRYDYYRQAAFYLDGAAGTEYIIIGISKRDPYHIFEVFLYPDSPQVLAARTRYQFILQKAFCLNISP
jgi:hypothetical protein